MLPCDCSGCLPPLHVFIWLCLALVALQVQVYTVKVSLCWNALLAGMGSSQQITLLLGKHKLMFWKGTLTLLLGRGCQGVVGVV